MPGIIDLTPGIRSLQVHYESRTLPLDDLMKTLLHAESERLLSDDHFTVDGTLLKAWASHKSFQPRDQDPPPAGGGNPTRDFHGQRRRNAWRFRARG